LFQLLNVFWVNDFSQTEIHKAGGLVHWGWGDSWNAEKI